ncbi:MAG: ATP-binding protein [Phycisphaerae bacterium]|nr:ATP-binding protein [Phycisphaerae bacterium]
MVSETPTKKIRVVDSDVYAISKICGRLLDEVRAKNYNSEEIFAIHLALEEAILNALKHGNKFDPKKTVDIDYLITDEKCDIAVADEGAGFSPDSLPDPRAEENLYKPCGRGVLLMRSYMDVVEFNEHGNRVHMIKYKKTRKA